MVGSLFIVAFLFIVQTWLASLLAGGREAFSDDEVGNAFFKLVEAASSTGWMNAFFVVNVLAVGFANAMAAQAATSRLLYSMSRDRQLPSFLSKVSARQVPMAAILVVSAISVVLVLFFVGQIALISSLVNFGALFAFCLLHVSVVWYYIGRKKSKNYLLHLVVPTLGFLIIGYVCSTRTRSPRSAASCGLASARWCSSSTRCAGGVCRNWATIGRFPMTYAISHTPSDAVLRAVTHLSPKPRTSSILAGHAAPVATKSVADWASIDACANSKTGETTKQPRRAVI